MNVKPEFDTAFEVVGAMKQNLAIHNQLSLQLDVLIAEHKDLRLLLGKPRRRHHEIMTEVHLLQTLIIRLEKEQTLLTQHPLLKLPV